MNQNEKLAELLLPGDYRSPEDYEKLYPPREGGVRVTRIAPSPTGYLHLGTLFTALINRLTADDGVFYVRIEDTDKKREVEGAIADIVSGLKFFGIDIDEGFSEGDAQSGEYGPYRQSERADIYKAYIKELIKQGRAYPCFCSEDDLSALREKQEAEKIRTGYHGEWARCRDLSFEEINAKLNAGEPWVIRFRSEGDENRRIVFDDGVKGKIEMPENDEDFVILKSDGLPTYHFAHAVDDHLMRTTHVIRGDEWISSVPKHIELFKTLGFRPPKYAHVSPIMKKDGDGKRKLSKRKDPEAAASYFIAEGYPASGVIEYLMTVASSDYEDWRRANPEADRKNFKFSLKRMSVSGALFDQDKLCDVSKRVISEMTAGEVLSQVTEWSERFDPEFYNLLSQDPAYAERIFAIDRGCKNPRKDISKWSDARDYCAYFYDSTFIPCDTPPENISHADAAEILYSYAKKYKPTDNKDDWFSNVKSICEPLGFASDTREYKKNPELYKGGVADVSTVIRLAVTGRSRTPDLCAVMYLLGEERCRERLLAAASRQKELISRG